MNWLSTIPTSYWQQGCDDGKAGRPRRLPGDLYPGYRNGYEYGSALRSAGIGVAASSTHG